MGRAQDALEVFHEGGDKHAKYRWGNRGGLYAIQTKLGLTYLLLGDIETAESWIGLTDDNDRSPDSARAHALLELLRERTVDLDRILERFKLAKARNRHERSIIHLYAAEILCRRRSGTVEN